MAKKYGANFKVLTALFTVAFIFMGLKAYSLFPDWRIWCAPENSRRYQSYFTLILFGVAGVLVLLGIGFVKLRRKWQRGRAHERSGERGRLR